MLDGRSTSVGDGSSVAVVAVDADKVLAIGSLDIIDGDFSGIAAENTYQYCCAEESYERLRDNLPILFAITTAAIKLSKILDGEAIDGDRPNTIMLNNLVLSTTSTTSNDLTITITLEGQGVLAYSIPPHILNRASTQTMHTLTLIFTDDGILEGSAVFEKEHGIRVAAFGLAAAGDAASVGLVAAVESARDGFC